MVISTETSVTKGYKLLLNVFQPSGVSDITDFCTAEAYSGLGITSESTILISYHGHKKNSYEFILSPASLWIGGKIRSINAQK
jgi:hypothetical protein